MSNLPFLFNSQIQLGPVCDIPPLSNDVVKNEPMFFSCDREYVQKHAGPITQYFIDNLSEEFKNSPDLIIDSRVHMLMPNFWPCIPGWHHDDVPRNTQNGQPNYHNPEYRAKHCMMLVNGDVAPTEFALGESLFLDVEPGEKYYKVWHEDVNNKLASGGLKSFSAPSNQLIYFDCDTWHRGTKAVKFGWRWFIRATINTHRKVLNETRSQVQVYVNMEQEGW